MTPLFRRSPSADAAFERLYRRHVTDVYRYAYAVLGEQADAEDVTQTTFLNAYRAYQRGERAQKPENWLIAIAHNVCRQRFRQAQRRPEVALDEIDAVAPVDEGPTADDLKRAFAQLPPNQREALVMRELEGRPYAEIAAIMGISVSALETLIFRARRSLREQLEEQLTCEEAAFALSRQADGRLSGQEKRQLRAHLRACPDCARAAQRDRAIRGALKGVLAVPLPQALASFFGGAAGSTAAGTAATSVGLKALAVLAAGAVAGGGTYAAVEKPKHHAQHPVPPSRLRATVRTPVSDPVKLTGSDTAKRTVAPRGKALGHAKHPVPAATIRSRGKGKAIGRIDRAPAAPAVVVMPPAAAKPHPEAAPGRAKQLQRRAQHGKARATGTPPAHANGKAKRPAKPLPTVAPPAHGRGPR